MSVEITNGIYAWDLPEQNIHEKVMAEVCIEFECSQEDLRGPSKLSELVNARRVFCYLMRRKSGYTLKRLGSIIQRDHSVVAHHAMRMDDFLFTKDPLVARLQRIETKLKEQGI